MRQSEGLTVSGASSSRNDNASRSYTSRPPLSCSILMGDKVAMNPLRASSKLWVSSKFSFCLKDCCIAFVGSVAAFGARMDSGSGEYVVTVRFAISSQGGVGYRVPTATQVQK